MGVKKLRLKKSVKSTIKLILGILLMLLATFIISNGIKVKGKRNKVIINLNNQSSIDYQVYLHKNDYFNVPYLGKGERYIASLIDNININYNYQFNASKKFNYTYQYRIVGTINAIQTIENAKKNVWSKEFILKPNTEVIMNNSNHFEINDNLVINYNQYNKMLEDFKNTYVLAVNASMDIKLYVDIVGNYEGYNKQIKKSNVMTLNIPMSNQTIDINESSKGNTNTSILGKPEPIILKNMPLFISGSLLFIISVIYIIASIKELIKNNHEQVSYEKELAYILDKYDDIIVNAKSIPKLNYSNLIDVTTIEELINAEEELHIPIIFSELVPGYEGWFTIIYNNQVWRFILKVK